MDGNEDINKAFGAIMKYADNVSRIEENFDIEFEQLWRRQLKMLSKDDKSKIKQNFVKEMVPSVERGCIILANKYDITIEPADLPYEKIISYIVNYHLFYTSHLSDCERAAKQGSKEYKDYLINKLSNDIFHRELKWFESSASVYSPVIVKCDLCCNVFAFFLFPYRADLKKTVSDVKAALFLRAVRLIKNVLNALTDGIANDAAGIWRTLHEVECVITVLNKYGDEVSEKYYGLEKYYDLEVAKINGEESGRLTALREELDKERAPYTRFGNETGYINYGWLAVIPDFGQNAKDRFEFATLQKYAGQEDRFIAYRTACKSAHSGVFAIASRQDEWFDFVLSQLVSTILNLFVQLRAFLVNFKDFDCRSFEYQTRDYLQELDECYKIYLKKRGIKQ